MSEMSITFIGTGSAFNHKYGNNSALLEFEGTNLLLDCGHDVPALLQKMNKKIGDITNIWISHMHADHIGGIEEIAFVNKFVNAGKKTNLFIPIEFFSDFKIWFESTTKYGEKLLSIEDYFHVFPVKRDFSINKETFLIIKTEHIPNMPAYMLKGKNFIFTADTKFVDWSKMNLNGIDFIFQDTQLDKYGEDDVHASLPDLNRLPLPVKRKIYCMHYGENIDSKNISNTGMRVVSPTQRIILK